jgi:hypothetical protein
MNLGEAWNTAAETTGVDGIGTELGLGFGLFLATFEVIWWAGIAFIVKRRILQSDHTDD